MKRCCPVEKVVDYSSADFVVSFLDPICIGVIEQLIPRVGAGLVNRIGNRVFAKKFHLRARCVPSQANAAAYPSTLVKLALVFDRQANGAAPVFQDIYRQHQQDGTSPYSFNSFPSIFNEDRFRVLFEKNYILPPIGVLGAYAASPIDGALNSHPLCVDVCLDIMEEMVFKSDLGTVADIVSGSLVLVNACNINVGTFPNAPWLFDMSWRLEFEDI